MKRLMIIGLWPDDAVNYCTEKCDCRRYAFDRILYHRGGRAARERICIPVVDRSGATTTYLDLPVTLLEAGVVYLRLDDGSDIFLSNTQMALIANEVERQRAECAGTGLKTLGKWFESGLPTAEDYLEPGDEVDEDLIGYFLDVLPPRTNRAGLLQMPSRSISLNDYMKQLIKAHNADIDTEGTPEEFDMTLREHLFDGPETIEGLLAEHYTLSWALASLRDKLKHYEDALIPEIMPEGLQTIDRAIGTYGKDAQLTKAVEEMSELTKALCKLKECKRKHDTPFNRETQEVYSNIEEEIADVFIMLVQLFAIFNPHELVNITKIVWDKLDRLKDNLDKEAAKQEANDAGKE